MSEITVGRTANQSVESKAKTSAPRVSEVAGPIRPVEQSERAIREFDGFELQILMKNAQVLIDAKEHRLALNLLRGVLMRSPEHQEALLKMGLCLREDGRLDEALKCFKALARTGSAEARVLIAETLYLGERDQHALSAYREVLKSPGIENERLFEIYKNVGNIHVRAGDFESAEEFYNKAYTLNPDSDVLMVNYGTLEIQRESIEEAVLRFRRAVELNPENDKAWVGLALVHRQMGDLELAWANVQRALDINRVNRTAIRLAIEWSVHDQRLSLAIARLQEYLAIEGEDAEMSFTLAKLFTHAGRLLEARLEMERVMALDPMIEGAEALVRVLDQELQKAAT